MAVINYFPQRKLRRIRCANFDAMERYLIQKVNEWLEKNPGQSFRASQLVGGDWNGSPLYPLYTHYVQLGKQRPTLCAGIACGWLLLEALQNDSRIFRTDSGYRRTYRLVN